VDEKDRFDRFMQLADFRLRRWDARRNAEWKISLSLWALLAATALYVPIPLDMFWVSVFLVLIWMSYTLFWALALLRRNLLDMDTAFHYTENAESILRHDVKPRPKPKESDYRLRSLWRHWTFVTQFLTTTIFLIAVGWLLSTKPWPK